jgi:hypothetical protein
MDGIGGLWKQRLRIAGERPVGEARRDIRQRVRAVRRVDEIAVEHHIVANPGKRNAMRLQGAKDRLQVVDMLGECRIFKRSAQTRRIDRHAHRGRIADREPYLQPQRSRRHRSRRSSFRRSGEQ